MSKTLRAPVYSSIHGTCCSSCVKSAEPRNLMKPSAWLPYLLSYQSSRLPERVFTLWRTRWYQHINDIISATGHTTCGS